MYHTIQSFDNSLNLMQQSACLVINPITVDNCTYHCTNVRLNDDSEIRLLILFGWAAALISVAGPIWVELMFFAVDFQRYRLTSQ